MKFNDLISLNLLKQFAVFIVTGYLFTAAALKALGDSEGSTEDSFAPAVQLLAMQGEIFVGAWLLTGRLRVTGWLTGIALFVIFTLISFSSAVRGHSDCGCFGPVRVNPWFTTIFNVTALLLLVLCRPASARATYVRSSIASGCLVLAYGVVALLASGPFGDRLLARWHGEQVYITPGAIDAGTHPPGTKRTVRVRVVNRSTQPVRLVGGSVTCNCTVINSLLMSVPANESVEIEIELQFVGRPGSFTHKYRLFTDLGEQPTLYGIVAGKISGEHP